MNAPQIIAAVLLTIGALFAVHALVCEWKLDRAEREYLEHLDYLCSRIFDERKRAQP
jgi:hypothetical protein